MEYLPPQRIRGPVGRHCSRYQGIGGLGYPVRDYWRYRTAGPSGGAATMLDIDLAVRDLDRRPRARREAAGFTPRGRITHSEN